MMVFLRVLSLNTSSSTYFPLFQLALHAWQQPTCRSSISPPRNHVAFSFTKPVSFEHSLSSPSLLWLREGKKTSRHMTDKSFSAVCRRSILSSPRSRSRPAQQRCNFISNSKYQYRPLTQPDVADCQPWEIDSIWRKLHPWHHACIARASLQTLARVQLATLYNYYCNCGSVLWSFASQSEKLVQLGNKPWCVPWMAKWNGKLRFYCEVFCATLALY